MSKEMQEKTIGFDSFPVEIIHDILRYLRKADMSTLYSCIRVNRNLCKLVIPYIWNNPMPNTYSLINLEIFINLFDEKDKNLLKNQYELDIDDTYQPLFNYTSYIKVLDPRGVRRAAFYWLKNYYVQKFPYSDIYVDFKNNPIIDIIEKSLLRIILKNSSKIENLILDFAEKYQDIPSCNIFLLKELQQGGEGGESNQSEQLSHGIREITKLSIMNPSLKRFDNIQEFLDLLPTICTNIKKIKFYDLFFIEPTMELKLCNVIKSQRNLTSINLTYNIFGLISVIRHQRNSLKKLVLRYIHHNDICLFNTFDQLINLEFLEINECFPINIILEPLIRANLKLVTLKIIDIEGIEGKYDLVESIIKSSGSTLKHLSLNIYVDLIEDKLPLSKLCPNLIHLDLKVSIRVIDEDDDIDVESKKQPTIFNYIDSLKHLKNLHLEFAFYVIGYFEEFDQYINFINFPSLRFISLKDQHYSSNFFKRWFEHFSTMFNKITFYIDSESDEYYFDPLDDFVQEMNDNGLSLVYTFDGYSNFVATDRILC
ncbi:hypothetical protein RclHR1_07250005 [Rhizophagus clarus]|uniref:F-box domain-containing protein n=1 Tax=Rhizophagus clarus TaxID=94130 RepID=A0A2Z6S230_9GLOM|nr:hypothetical protein RclHR1_07250005 [Rhizophagus clarus]GES97694.1 hypothetical protein GLOIN_2v1518809 [Rhizophagus clarus]